MGNSSIFGIGLSGLNAAQAGLVTTGHNIANVNTAGYTRQQVLQSARAPQFGGSGYFGTGVNVDTVRRVYSEFLSSQVRQSQGSAAEFEVSTAQLTQLDNLIGDPDSSLAPALDDFFAGVNAVAARPSDIPSRQTMLSSAQALVSRFAQLGEQMTEIRTGVNTQIESSIGSINSLATQLAGINKRITEANAVAGGLSPPNDLLDQRDNLLLELNRQVGSTGVEQSDGSLNVFLSNGQALVVGDSAYALKATRSVGSPIDVTVGLQTPGGVLPFRTQDFAGGALSALLSYRDGELATTENGLGRIAITIADAFNDQHQLGQDLTGALGGNFFITPAPKAATLVGTAQISATLANPGALTTSDYQLAYDGTNYTLTRLEDGTSTTYATLPQTVDGITIALVGGTPAAGDLYSIKPTRTAATDLALAISDPRQIAAAAPIATSAAKANTGTGAISAGSVGAPLSLVGLPVGFTFGNPPSTFTTTVATTVNGVAYAAGAAIPHTGSSAVAFQGISLTLTGAPAAGDVFTVGRNTGGSGDNRNALLLSAIADQKLIAGGTTTMLGAYGQMVSRIGNATREAAIESEAQNRLLAQALSTQASVSGVNLDEEAANLQRYQQAYQAAGKVMAVAASLFETVLGIFRG